MADKREDDGGRFNQGIPGMLADGQINTIGPDGKPTHPVKVYFPNGEVFTMEQLAAGEGPESIEDYDAMLDQPPEEPTA